MIVRATADNQNQLRFTAEHQLALHTDGAWVSESGPRSSVTHSSRYSGSGCLLHVIRRGLQSTRRTRKSRTKERRKERARSGETPICNRHFKASVNRKITKRHKAESIGIQQSTVGKTVLWTPKTHVGGME
jgi:hypothetical protein